MNNTVISASAGSGKTYSLAGRYLEAVYAGVDPSQILATTFTRAAAGEIASRVLNWAARAVLEQSTRKELSQLTGAVVDEQTSQAHFVALCDSIHRLMISTLDSFFQRIYRAAGAEIGASQAVTPVAGDSPEAVRARLRTVLALLEGADGRAMLELLREHTGSGAGSAVVRPIGDLAGSFHELWRAIQPDAWERASSIVPAAVSNTEISQAIAGLEAEAKVQHHGNVTRVIQGIIGRIRAGDWAGLLGLAAFQEVPHDGMTVYRRTISPEGVCAYKKIHEAASHHVLKEVATKTQSLHHMMALLDRAFTESARAAGIVLFSEVPAAIREVMGSVGRSDLEWRMDGMPSHLLLDEFQDTSLDQWKVMEDLVRAVGELGGAFAVGDVKQSIYGWRGGAPALFASLRAALPAPSEETRVSSYRSSQVVLDAVNAVFGNLAAVPSAALRPDAAREWTDYHPHEAANTLSGCVTLTQVDAPDEGAEGTEDGDGDGAAEPGVSDGAGGRVKETPTTQAVIGRIKAERDAHPDATCAVIVRTNATAASLISALRAAGIDAAGAGGVRLSSDPAVQVIMSALQFADHSDDTAAAFRLHHSPLAGEFGLTDLPVGPIPEDPQARSDFRQRRQEVTGPAADAVRRRLSADGLASTVARWARILTPAYAGESPRRLQQLVALADSLPDEAHLRPSEFLKQIDGARLSDAAASPVRVMTVHASKGLEFDIVVLPELGFRTAHNEPQVLVQRASAVAEVEAVWKRPSTDARKLSPTLSRAYDSWVIGEQVEALSLLYVAMTRARQALHLILQPPTTDGAHQVVRAAVVAGLGDHTADAAPWTLQHSASATREERPAAAVRVLQGELRAERAPRPIAPSSLERREHGQAAGLLSVGGATGGQAFGTLIHAWLAAVQWADAPAPTDDELHRLARAAQGRRAIVDADAQIARFRSMLAGPNLRAILARPGGDPELWRERPFAARTDDGLLNGTFDRVVIHRQDGKITGVELIDFKTDDVRGSEVGPRTRMYEPQIAAYRAALAVMLGVDAARITAKLLYLSVDRIVEL